MHITFKTRKLKRTCESETLSNRAWGVRQAAVVRLRLAQLAAAGDLGVMEKIPGARLHELKGNRAGQFAVDGVHPHRIVFVPEHDPVPTLPDGGTDRGQVTAIRILAVEDYH